MATTAQRDIASQMIAQLRLLDPSASAEIGTPERKIIDTVAQALYDSQVDLGALQQGLDIDSKYGAALDRFINIFGFSRQRPTYATGYVTFSRQVAATSDIRISGGTTVQATAGASVDDDGPATISNVPFVTLFDATIPAGSLSVTVPIRCVIAGTIGNVAAGSITRVVGTNTIYGVSTITNEQPVAGGIDVESDEELKVRFKNTVFRNLAGTKDQFLALAVATAFTSKANVVGPMSTYQEYVQVPPVDDASSYDPAGSPNSNFGGGNANEYTTALSTLPYAKYVYAKEQPAFVTNGQFGLGTIFYRQDTDYVFNGLRGDPALTVDPVKNRGDTKRFANLTWDVEPGPNEVRPNVTFKNVYTGTSPSVQAIRPGDVVLLEYSYLSQASRSDVDAGIYNTVDVYIDGGNETLADTVLPKPTTATAFVDNVNSKFHFENYRRIGEPEKRPILGNVFQALYWQPITNVPDQIVIGTNTYYRGQHYWPVEDVTNIGGTVRARTGIEWSTKLKGRLIADGAAPGSYTGQIVTLTSPDATDAFEVNAYKYDRNVIDLQASLEGSKQITTDVLAHKAKTRYLKLDITVMYVRGVSVSDTNNQIQAAVDTYLRSQFFGSVIQLSDLLQIIHAVPGVDNVRWTADSAGTNANSIRVYEADRNGVPLLGFTSDRIQYANGSVPEIQALYLQGAPGSGEFALNVPSTPSVIGGPRANTVSMPYNSNAATIQSAINAVITGTSDDVTVIEDVRTNVGVRVPVRSFTVTFPNNTPKDLILPSTINSLGANVILGKSSYGITSDFFLRDDELARLPDVAYVPLVGLADTVPGLIIRPRAQNTWTRTR